MPGKRGNEERWEVWQDTATTITSSLSSLDQATSPRLHKLTSMQAACKLHSCPSSFPFPLFPLLSSIFFDSSVDRLFVIPSPSAHAKYQLLNTIAFRFLSANAIHLDLLSTREMSQLLVSPIFAVSFCTRVSRRRML